MDHVLIADTETSILWSLSADGSIGAVHTNNLAKRTGWDISILNLADGKMRAFIQTPFNENAPALSADGRWLAYHSNESGRSEIYVQSLQDDGGKWQISTDGGVRPRWSRGDREILFLSPDDKLMVVDVKLTPGLIASVPRLLLDPRIRQLFAMQYAISPDGNRILVNRAIEQRVVAPVTLVQNWTAALGK